ncbi:phasin family protein [Microvirga terricola]|uniref:Phasin family protein n=1 Tax=Microvirga terricola TaxID=2719797 RepID=A0ABX0VD19_9HYPH|nr:phasin family protein [Microvirga terricola]NIX77729.1 phasin family protein [Microvirga terricola]
MIQSFDEIQKFGQDSMDAAMRSLGALSSNAQAIAAESAEYARKTFEQGSSAVEKLFGVRTIDKAVEVQTDYVKGAYDSLVSQSAKMSVLYSALATETLKPYEGFVAKATKA